MSIENCENINETEKKFNWGAFLLTWIWLFRYKKYWFAIGFLIVTFLIFFPIIGWIAIGLNLGLAILAGIKGNEWAINSCDYNNVEDFNINQHKWVKAGIIVWLLIIISLASMMIPNAIKRAKYIETYSGVRRTATILSEILKINDIDMVRFPETLDTQNITQYFYASMGGFDGELIADDTIKMMSNDKKSETTYKFTGNGECSKDKPCTILVDINGKKKPNKLWTEPEKYQDQYEIPLILSEDKKHFTMDMPEVLKKAEKKAKEDYYKGREELNPDNYQ